MKTFGIRHSAFAILLSFQLSVFSGCAGFSTWFENGGSTAKVSPVLTGSQVGAVAVDLNTAAQQALAGYAKVKSGNVDYVWGLTQAFNAYATIVKTSADVRALVAAWDGTKDQSLANRLASLFGAATGSTAQRMAILAAAAQETAQALDSP